MYNIHIVTDTRTLQLDGQFIFPLVVLSKVTVVLMSRAPLVVHGELKDLTSWDFARFLPQLVAVDCHHVDLVGMK